MGENKLKVIVLTQKDGFFIPTNILKAAKECDIVEVVNNAAKSSLDNKISDMVRWFGFFQCAKMGVKTYARKFCDLVDNLSGLKTWGGTCSIASAAKKIGAEYRTVTDVNSPEYVEHVRAAAPDLIISYSAPQVIKPELLGIPKYGVLNVHGALLPDYRGCFPSFWYLYNDEKLGGATVHYMSAAIDDGDICVQRSVDLSDCRTMFQVMGKTKLVGGEAMVEAIQRITDGTLEPRKNDTENGRYFTWPTAEQARQFRKKGKKLI